MDHTLQEWVRLAQDSDLAQAAIDAQAHETRRTSTEVFRTMRSYWHNMQEAIQEGLQPNLRSVSGLSGGQAVKLLERIKTGKALSGNLLGKAEAYALATAECNACMGKIVAAPTAGVRHSAWAAASNAGRAKRTRGRFGAGTLRCCGSRKFHCRAGQHLRG